MRRIYLDHNATTPVHPEVVAEMLPCLHQVFGNPNSLHEPGQEARRVLDRARQRVADAIGAEAAEEIVFTSGGTEADNLALLGAAARLAGKGRHLITTAIEHEAVLASCRWLEGHGWQVSYLPVDGDGRLDPAAVAAAWRADTVLVSVMLANNEVGTLQPVAEVARLAHERGAIVHTDAVQAVGKLRVDVRALGVDLLALTAHKIYGPKGAGALYVRRGTPLAAILHGGHHERRRRAGTENVPGIAGLGKACERAAAGIDERAARVGALRDRLESELAERLPWARVHGRGAPRVSGTTNVSFPGVDAEMLLLNLDLVGVAASTGAACTAGSGEPSHVLVAMGLPDDDIRGSLRLSLGEGTTGEEIDLAVAALADLAPRLRR